MQHWWITGNSNVTIQTGSTCISDSMIDITTIPTANLGFSTKASLQKVTSERQPEIAIWSPKPEIVISLELQQIALKLWWQDWDFRQWRARIKCRQVTATTTDNRKCQCGHHNRKYLYLWNYDKMDDNSNGKSGVFDHAQREKLAPGDYDNDRQPETAI